MDENTEAADPGISAGGSDDPRPRDRDAFDPAAFRAELDELKELVEEASRPPSPRELLRLLRQAADQGLQSASVPEARWHAVLVPDTGKPSCEAFASAADLAAFLREARGQGCHAFPFYGRRCAIAGGGHYLLTHDGRFDLYTAAPADEVDPAGYLGPADLPHPGASSRRARPQDLEDIPDDDARDEDGGFEEGEDEDDEDSI